MRIVVSPQYDPYLNIAAEKTLFDEYDGEDTVFLWVNDPCVVIGRNQNAWLETDRTVLEEEDVRICRRYTGGGAVYQDHGNLNYSWITGSDSPKRILDMVSGTLRSFGMDAVRSERNDLLTEGRKFSGTASLRDDGKYLFHGTLMIGVDIARLERVLKPSRLKMQSHGIDSVRSRVINLNTVLPELSTERFTERFSELYPADTGVFPGDRDDVKALRNQLAGDAWLYEQSPGFDVLLEYRINGSLYQVSAKIVSGRIDAASVYTDSLDPADVSHIADRLRNMLFDEERIEEVIRAAL